MGSCLSFTLDNKSQSASNETHINNKKISWLATSISTFNSNKTLNPIDSSHDNNNKPNRRRIFSLSTENNNNNNNGNNNVKSDNKNKNKNNTRVRSYTFSFFNDKNRDTNNNNNATNSCSPQSKSSLFNFPALTSNISHSSDDNTDNANAKSCTRTRSKSTQEREMDNKVYSQACSLLFECQGNLGQALLLAVSSNNVSILQCLFNIAAKKHHHDYFMTYRTSNTKETLLMRAALYGNYQVLSFLINQFNQYKNAIFETISHNYGDDISELILKYMGDWVNIECKAGKSPLIYACCCKHKSRINIVNLLLNNGASIIQCSQSKYGKPALIYAVELKHIELVKTLLDHGADVNAQDRHGWTALHYATKFNERDLVRCLLDYNGNPLIFNQNNQNCIDIALDDQCYAALQEIDITQIPTHITMNQIISSTKKSRWGRNSQSYSIF